MKKFILMTILTMSTMTFSDGRTEMMEHIDYNSMKVENFYSQVNGGFQYEELDGDITNIVTYEQSVVGKMSTETDRRVAGDNTLLALHNSERAIRSYDDKIVLREALEYARVGDEMINSSISIIVADQAVKNEQQNDEISTKVSNDVRVADLQRQDKLDVNQDKKISNNRDSIRDNTNSITEESEIREIVDNNLAKGVDSNAILINEEERNRILGDEKVLSDARDYSYEGDQLINSRITENQGNQAVVDYKQDKKIVENTNSINEEIIVRTQADIRHDREIMNNSRGISKLNSKIDGVESKMSKGVAAAIATAHAIPINLNKGDAGIGVGYGNFNGNSSIALGLGIRPTENLNVNISMGASQGGNVEYSVGAGASYKINLF